jgi:hypothetical protein
MSKVALFVVCFNFFHLTDAYIPVPDIEFKTYIQSLMLQEEEEDNQKSELMHYEQLCISLGFNCTMALQLDRNQLRKKSFPFDWNVTSLQGLCDVIDNHFADFLNPHYLIVRTGSAYVPGVTNVKYNIALAHDFPDTQGVVASNYLDYLPDIQEKYERRIKRFYNACNMAEKVYFFRTKFWWWPLQSDAQDKENVKKLRDILTKHFPLNNWVLVVTSDDMQYKHDWQMPKVKNFYMSKGTDDEWNSVFRQLSLID